MAIARMACDIHLDDALDTQDKKGVVLGVRRRWFPVSPSSLHSRFKVALKTPFKRSISEMGILQQLGFNRGSNRPRLLVPACSRLYHDEAESTCGP